MIKKEELYSGVVYSSPSYKEMINFLLLNGISLYFMSKSDKGLWSVRLYGKMKDMKVKYIKGDSNGV